MDSFSNLDEFYQYSNSIISTPSPNAGDPDELDQEALRSLREKGHASFPDRKDEVDSILSKVNRDSRFGKGRYVNPNLKVDAPWIDPKFEELNEEEQVEKVEEFREKIPEFALQDPLNYDDNKHFMNALANEKLRHVQGNDTGWMADKGWRAFDAVAAGIASKLGSQDTADAIRAWSEENPNTDGNFSSALIQGFGDVGASSAIFFAATALSGGNVSVGAAALAATSGVERYTTTYKDAIDKGLSQDQALEAGIGSLPGAAVDYFADKLVIGKVLPKNLDDILAAGTDAAKRKALAEVFKNKDLRGEAMKLSRDFFVQGASEAAGDFTAGYGAYKMTDDESFIPKNEELAMSFLVGGVIGSVFSGYESVSDRMLNRKVQAGLAAKDKANATAEKNDNPNSAAASAAVVNTNTGLIPSVIQMGGETALTGVIPSVIPMGGEAGIPPAQETPGGVSTVDFNAPISTAPPTIGSFSPYGDTIKASNFVSEEEVALPVFNAYVKNEFGSVEPMFDTPIRPLASGMTETEKAISGMLTIPQVQFAATGTGVSDLKNVTPFGPSASITTATPALPSPTAVGLPAPGVQGLPAPNALPAPAEVAATQEEQEAPRGTATIVDKGDGIQELRVSGGNSDGTLLAVKKGNRHYLAAQRADGTPKLSKQISKSAFDKLVEDNIPVQIPVAVPAAKLEVAPPAAQAANTQIVLFESSTDTIAKNKVIDNEVAAGNQQVLEANPEIVATSNEMTEKMEDDFLEEAVEPSNPRMSPSSVFLFSKNGMLNVVPFGTINLTNGRPYLDTDQVQDVEKAAVDKVKTTDVNIYEGDSFTMIVRPTETGFEADPVPTEDLEGEEITVEEEAEVDEQLATSEQSDEAIAKQDSDESIDQDEGERRARAVDEIKTILDSYGGTIGIAKLDKKKRADILADMIDVLRSHNISPFAAGIYFRMMESASSDVRVFEKLAREAKPNQDSKKSRAEIQKRIKQKISDALKEGETDEDQKRRINSFSDYIKKKITPGGKYSARQLTQFGPEGWGIVNLDQEVRDLSYTSDPNRSKLGFQRDLKKAIQFETEMRNAVLDLQRELDERNATAIVPSVQERIEDTKTEAEPQPVVVGNTDSYPVPVEQYAGEESDPGGLVLQDNTLQGQPTEEVPEQEDPGSEPYEWDGSELVPQTNALAGQPWETTPVATPTAATVEATLSEDEKQEAAIELGLESWTLDAADRFVAKIADWLVAAKSVTAKLGALIKKVWDAIKIPSVLAAVAVNLGPEVANYMPAITNTQIMADINNYAAPGASTARTANPALGPENQPLFGPENQLGPRDQQSFQGTSGDIEIKIPKADFRGATASKNVRTMVQWIVARNDNRGKPIVIAEKPTGLIYFFDAEGVLIKKAPALYGFTPGDIRPPGKEGMTQDEIRGKKIFHVTESGRFETTSSTSKFDDYGESIRVTQSSADSSTYVHKVFLGRESTEHRADALEEIEETFDEPGEEGEVDPEIPRKSLSCINMQEKDMVVVRPLVREGSIMYILPETEAGKQLFEGFEDLDLSETDKPAQRTGFRVNPRPKNRASGSIINPAGAIKRAFKVLAGSVAGKKDAPQAAPQAEPTPEATPTSTPAAAAPNVYQSAAKIASDNNRVPAFVLKGRQTVRNSRAQEPRVKSIVGHAVKIYGEVKTKAEFKEELRKNYGEKISNHSDELWDHFKKNGTDDIKRPTQIINKTLNQTEKRPDILPANVKIYDETVTPIEQHGQAATASFKAQPIAANHPKGDSDLQSVTTNLKSKNLKIREKAKNIRDKQIDRFNKVKRLKIDDKYDTATDRIARLLNDIDISGINRMADHHVDQFHELVDHIYNSRSKGVANPDIREHHDGIIDVLSNYRRLIDSHKVRKMIKDFGDVMDFSGYDGAIDDLGSFAKYVDNMSKALKLDVSGKRKKNSEAFEAKKKAWRNKFKQNIARLTDQFKTAEDWIQSLEQINGGRYKKANRDLLEAHWEYMTQKVAIDTMEGNDLYNHNFEANNMFDGQPIYIPETSIKWMAQQINNSINFASLAGSFRDPYVSKNPILAGLDRLQEKVELQQTKLGRLSAVEDGKRFLQEDVMGPLMDSIFESVNDQRASLDEMLAAKAIFKETLGRDFDYNDSKTMAIAGRLVQYRIGRDMNAEFRRNLENEYEQIANVIGGGKKGKPARGTSTMRIDKENSKKILDRLVEGLDSSNKPMEDFMATILNRLGDGDEAVGKARFDLLSKMQEIVARYTPDNKLISENFYKGKKRRSFQQYANYMPRRVIPVSNERKGKDDVTATADELEDKMFQSQSFTAEGEQLKDRSSIGANGYYSDNIEYIFERGVRVSSITASTTAQRFILKERLKKGNGLYELIENGDATQERIDYMHRWAVGIMQNALHSGMPMGLLGKAVRKLNEAFTRSSLSGLHHLVSQMLTGISDYEWRTGNISGAMEAFAFVARNGEKADAFFTKYASRVMDRSARGEQGIDRRRMPDINPAMFENNPTFKALNKVYDGVSEAITWSLRKGDDITAKGLVLAEYIRLMKEKGHIIPTVDDMDFDNVDMRAISQAQTNIEQNINSSDKITRADFFVDRDPRISLLRNLSLAFASHNMALSSQFSQAIRDLYDLKQMGASREKMALQARTIGAIVTQTAVFASSRYAVGAVMSGVMIGLLRDLFDDEEGKLAELEIRSRHAHASGDDVKIAQADSELAQAKAISKSINAFQARNQSFRGYFQSVLKDELGVFHLGFSGPGLPQKLIFPVADNFEEKMYKESMSIEVANLEKRIKAAEARKEFTVAAKLKERKTLMEGAEYLPWQIEQIGNVGIGGITGSALQNIYTNIDEAREAAFGLREYSFNDLAISATAFGIGQSEITKFFRQVDKIEDDLEKRDGARTERIKKAKAEQDKQDANREKAMLRRLLGS
jgi:hypothetical protein